MKRASILSLLSLAVLAVIAHAHVVVRPAESRTGQVQKYTMRVPNEKQVVTTSVELAFANEIAIGSVDELAGWKLTLKKDPQGRIEGATWTGSLAPREVAEFTFSGQNSATPGVIEWKAVQTYQDGSKSEWTGAEGTRTAASRTKIVETDSGK